MIRRLKHHEIDFEKYRFCVENSAQRNAYAQAEFLDEMCEKSWELLVFDDYHAVMPIPITKKFGLRFVVRPIGIQQLGIFSKDDDANLNYAFFQFLKKKYRVMLYAFNEYNDFGNSAFIKLKNHVIEAADYEFVKKNYHADRRRNVRILQKDASSVSFVKITYPEAVRDFYLKFAKGISEKDRQRCFMRFAALASKGIVSFFSLKFNEETASLGIVLEGSNEVCAVTLCHNPEFNRKQAPSILIDSLLQHYMPEKRFSFMGSNIDSIANFNLRFGAEERLYPVFTTPMFRFLNKLKSIHLMPKNNLKKE